jgi:REP element-mobilizing transposase RayT
MSTILDGSTTWNILRQSMRSEPRERRKFKLRHYPHVSLNDLKQDSCMNTNPDRRGHAALRRGRMSVSRWCYLLTTVTHQRTPWFSDEQVADSVAALHEDISRFGDMDFDAWVLMPDHWHGVVRLGDQVPLSRFMNRFKTMTALAANATIGRSGSLWAASYHDRAIRNEREYQSAIDYVIANPVRAGLSDGQRPYPWLWVVGSGASQATDRASGRATGRAMNGPPTDR